MVIWSGAFRCAHFWQLAAHNNDDDNDDNNVDNDNDDNNVDNDNDDNNGDDDDDDDDDDDGSNIQCTKTIDFAHNQPCQTDFVSIFFTSALQIFWYLSRRVSHCAVWSPKNFLSLF